MVLSRSQVTAVERKVETQRDTACLWADLLIGCFRPRRFLNTLKSRPEMENEVPNQRKEVKDKLSSRST